MNGPGLRLEFPFLYTDRMNWNIKNVFVNDLSFAIIVLEP